MTPTSSINRGHHRRIKRRGKYFTPAHITQARIEAERIRQQRKSARKAKP